MGRRVAEIFRVYGEDTFRDHESAVLRTMQPTGAVLATGGGIVLREDNWREMRRLGVTAFLDVDPAALVRRLGAGRRKRPLLAFDDWEERLAGMCALRRGAYLQADVRLALGDLDLDGWVASAERELLEAERLRG